MQTLHFNINIQAPAKKVWEILWNDDTYRQWTKAFSETSYAKSDWKEGSKILFLDGQGSGMYSTIAKKIPNEFMSFKHIGEVKDNVEQPLTPESESWSGSMENYTLKENNGNTQLSVDVDIVDEHKDTFEKMFPEALNNVKRLSEA
jgi:hypothetical protein